MASVPTPAELQYQREHINDSQVPALIASNVVCIVVACVAIGLRFLCRQMGSIKYDYDDWLILAALVFTIGVVICQLFNIRYGAGRHTIIMTTTTTSYKPYTEALLAAEVLYNVATCCMKFSILYLYSRVFFVSRRFIIILIGVAIFIFIYSGIQGIGSLIQCLPINANWNPHVGRKCLKVAAADTVFGIANVTSDIVILILPMPLLWGLQTPFAHKIKLISMFLLGGFVVFASIYRAVVIHNLTKIDPSWSDSPSLIWTAIEMGTGIMSVCMPTYRPIFTKLMPKIKSKIASFGSGWKSDRQLEFPVDMRTNWSPYLSSVRSEQDVDRSDPLVDRSKHSRPRPSQTAMFAHVGILGGDWEMGLERDGAILRQDELMGVATEPK